MLSLPELEKLREERGLQIVNNGKNHINRVSENDYAVQSQSGNGSYLVALTEASDSRSIVNGRCHLLQCIDVDKPERGLSTSINLRLLRRCYWADSSESGASLVLGAMIPIGAKPGK